MFSIYDFYHQEYIRLIKMQKKIDRLYTSYEGLKHRMKENVENKGDIQREGHVAISYETSIKEEDKNNITVEESADNEDYQMVPIGGHRLPPLPYDYDALEPFISKRIMKLHHDKHHKSYVDGLNKAEKELQKARESGDYSLIKHWERELAFNGAGHYLHTLFWYTMKPMGSSKAKNTILYAINDSFGSFKKFKEQFFHAAEKVEGSGWAALVWSPRSHRLEILQFEKHQNLSQQDIIPLLVLDVWEHAYYLQYENDRRAYIEAWWKIVNWDYVNKRFEKAKKVMWYPF